MNYREFQHLARLFIVGALDEDELEAFTTGRMLFGKKAERFLAECRDLNAAFALSLRPIAPRPGAKERLMQQILVSERERFGSEREEAPDAYAMPLSYKASVRN